MTNSSHENTQECSNDMTTTPMIGETEDGNRESPEYVRTSIAAAMTLGFKKGRFYRNATSPCVNVLLSYDSGCAGNCGYCGLSHVRKGDYSDKSFIRVDWPSYTVDDIMEHSCVFSCDELVIYSSSCRNGTEQQVLFHCTSS